MEISVKGPINPATGMVLDFGYIKNVVNRYVVDVLDHGVINYIIPELRMNATVEMLGMWIWKTLIEFLPGLYEIKLYETPTSAIIYRGPSRAEIKKKDNEIDKIFSWYNDAWQKLISSNPEISKYEVIDEFNKATENEN